MGLTSHQSNDQDEGSTASSGLGSGLGSNQVLYQSINVGMVVTAFQPTTGGIGRGQYLVECAKSGHLDFRLGFESDSSGGGQSW